MESNEMTETNNIRIKEEQEKQNVCLSCMECCKIMAFTYPVHIVDNTFVDFYRARGCEVRFYNNLAYVIVPMPCPHLDKKKGCTIYNSRPIACRMYSGIEDPIIKDKCKWNKIVKNG